MRRLLSACCVLILLVLISLAVPVKAADPWLEVAGGDGPGKGKKVVLVSGDEEYRSEEALPQLAKILARHHGFDCTVVFAIDPATGMINPNTNDNIPGLEKLASADLMVIATRFRNLPDEQMKHVDAFLKAGKPVVAMRTATHAFNIPEGRAYRRYSWDFPGEGFAQGFGRCSARPGSATTAAMAARARAGSSPPTPKITPSSVASRMVRSGGRPTSTVSASRSPVIPSRSSSGRCSRA